MCDNVETMIASIEFAQVEQTVLASLALGNESLKNMQAVSLGLL